MNDEEAVVALEADFTEVYHRDLSDLWKKNSGMTVRWVISHFKQLTAQSRVWKHLLGDRAEWGYKEHLLADIRDIVTQGAFFGMLQAQGGFKQSEWQKAIRQMPTTPLRPGDKEPEVEFATTDQLVYFFGGGKIKPPGRP